MGPGAITPGNGPRWRPTTPVGALIASMGPGAITPGNQVTGPAVPQLPELASMGPGAITPGNLNQLQSQKLAERLQWGPGQSPRETATRPSASPPRPTRFNGARGNHPGKREIPAHHERHVPLQWGPGQSPRETGCRPRPSDPPAGFNGARGNHPGKRPHRVQRSDALVTQLQWGPGQSPRETTRERAAVLEVLGRASMGPGAITPGNVGVPRRSAPPVALQWGPGQSPRETSTMWRFCS